MRRDSIVPDAVRQDVLGFQRALLALRMPGRGCVVMTDEKFKFTPLKPPRSEGTAATVAEKGAVKAADKPVDKPSAEKSVEKPAEKVAEKPAEKPRLDLAN